MNIKQTYITKNDCYRAGRTITPKGIMVHSTATPGIMAADWYSRWNRSGLEVAVHAFVDNKEVCQHLPWNHRAWHCGASGNNTHIAFEMCEPKSWKTDTAYFKACYKNAVELAAYLCKKYGLTEKQIVSHKEGYKKGIASNHGDPAHWWSCFGKTMDDFRSDVKTVLAGGNITVNVGRGTILAGSTGENVKTLQTRLNKVKKPLRLTYSTLQVDGIFGTKTTAAVKAFQKARKLTTDGICGQKTWDAVMIDYGDINGDGKVNAVDAQKVLKAAVGKEKLTAAQKSKADINADGKVDAKDAMEILKSAVGK